MSVFLSRIVFSAIRSANSKLFSVNAVTKIDFLKPQFLCGNNDLFAITRHVTARNYTAEVAREVETPASENPNVALKKKHHNKKVDLKEISEKEGYYLTLAYATAHSYDLNALREALNEQKLYEPETLKAPETEDVLVARAVYSVGKESREIMFFKEGATIFWNCTELEASNVLDFIKQFEIDSFPKEVVLKEKEIMSYIYQPNAKSCHVQENCFVLVPHRDNTLEKYTFGHAMAQSARLGALESRLEALADSVRKHTSLMEREGIALLDKKEAIRQLGELFALRHKLNVEYDLLDTPDFYWEQEKLERLYSYTIAYFTIPRRTRVLNNRVAHCVELLELLSGWANDRHHVRLEWMVIALILAEVCFELLHFFERYMGRVEAQRQEAA